jgi:homoserine kinase type II
MSVFTAIRQDQLEYFLESYPIGGLAGYSGIVAGIENTNYFVTTSGGEFVLTLFEVLPYEEVGYFLELTAYLAGHGVPSAHPVAGRDGAYLRRINGKPVALFQKMPGAVPEHPDTGQCAALGSALGRMHRVGDAFPLRRSNDRGPLWWRQEMQQLSVSLDADAAARLQEEVGFQCVFDRTGLPAGVIHGDLFRDNTLFMGERLTGLLDFYNACDDLLLYDLAIAVNDWCISEDRGLDDSRTRSLLAAYHAERPLLALERKAWPVMLRAGALRFWLSRLRDNLFPRVGEMTFLKDPEEFRRMLVSRIAAGDALCDLWPG